MYNIQDFQVSILLGFVLIGQLVMGTNKVLDPLSRFSSSCIARY